MDICKTLNLPRHDKPYLSRGKHKHEPIDEVPIDYLQWVVDTWDPGDSDYKIAENELYNRAELYG